MSALSEYRVQWLGNIRGDVLAGLVVALALIPEAIAFSVIAGVDPKVGLYASFSIAVLVAIAGGRAGMISAATAATAVLMVTLVKDYGLQYLLATTVLAGLIQIVAGLLKLGVLMRFVSRSVMTGFVNALAILIFLAQLPELVGVTWLTYVMVAAGLAIIYLFPRLTRVIPSPLVCILVLTGASLALGLEVRTVTDLGELPDTLPVFLIPDIPLTWETLMIILPFSAAVAAVGLLESLMTASIVDDLTDTLQRQEPRVHRPGHRQHRHRLHRRHGRLCDDRPVHHQREVRWPRSALDLLRRRHLAAVPVRRDRASGFGPIPMAALGRHHDHGVRRHVQLVVDQGPPHPSAQLVSVVMFATVVVVRPGTAQPRALACPHGRAAVRPFLRLEDRADIPRHLDPVT